MNNTNPLISVIMSVYKEKDSWLTESIESVLSQTLPDFEFIIVLDNPGSPLGKILEDYQAKDSRIKIIFNDNNLGLVKSLNLALSVAKGCYIARMDADDISHKDRLKKQLEFIVKTDCDLIGGNVNLFRNNNEIIKTTDKVQSDYFLKKMLKHGTICMVHPTFFFKRKVVDIIGNYNEAECAEDLEFLMRAGFYKMRMANLEDVILNVRYSENSITKENAYFMYCTVMYLREMYNKSIENGHYGFSNDYFSMVPIDEGLKDKFTKKQRLLAHVQFFLLNKKYFRAFFYLCKALILSDTVWFSIKVNIYQKVYRLCERLC